MKNSVIFKWSLAIFIFTFTAFKVADTLNSPAEESLVKWYSFEEAVKLNEKAPRKIMVDAYTDWCGWCKVMDKKTFNHPKIASYLNANYYCVKLDAEGKNDIVIKGRTYKFIAQGTRGYHELAAELLGGKMSYPTVVFMNEELGIIQAIPGYQEPAGFEPIIKYFAGNAYKTIAWEEYQKSFKSELE